ncbi:DUF305 domain-containing protein [Rhodococcus sp. NPDC003318]|uniref:DUF305 domain-containing protein n=1 Tax=Rhodococcus sp. NPDC003318 TaxID=3364503 RepID=UPI0036B4DDBB
MIRFVRPAALASLALLLLVVGAALRPLVIPETPHAAPVLDDVEIGFVQDMAAHHQQALLMTGRLASDVDPVVTALARQMSDAQRVETGTLLGWLRLVEAPPTNPRPMAWQPAVGHEHAGAAEDAMPGMATTAELDALAAAHGREAEVLFLQLMQRHHLGGVAMARAADQVLTGGPVEQAARDMMQEQGREAGLMTLMLAQRGARPLG